VSLITTPVNVSEDVGNSTVCVNLTASANTERSLEVYINTEANTAMGKLLFKKNNESKTIVYNSTHKQIIAKNKFL